MIALDKKHVIFIGGATASGKTSLAIELAKHFNCEIISGDSRQFYEGMPIGTAQPSSEELAQVPHHFIGCSAPNDEINAGKFEKMALALCEKLFEKHNYIVCVGGSGLYLKALYHGFHEFPNIKEGIREELNNDFTQHGLKFLQDELKLKDPARYAQVDENNHQRLIRSLEIIRSTGKTYSSFTENQNSERDFTFSRFQPKIEREHLYERINTRVDFMYAEGLLDEVKKLKPFWNNNSLKTVGYTENIAHLNNELSLTEASELLKKNTRNFAKRQITWFKKEEFLAVSNLKEAIDYL